ncbi:MAG: uncharacterized protein KVP18_005031 [Porospora cf. gigantea A]|uniref:uncharacterized protein n=2 Tax=Porospora cf. gigantea A TaxID=2853593 RepID=UPI00355A137B|nr:MAG: hypothetical protein KVP18_005031 [Porospora cf. gigantea A]
MSDVDHIQTEFHDAGAGASHTFPMQAGAIKKGSFVMLKGKPCKVVDYSTSKTGKHGHAKANITGIDIFTGNKYVDICPTGHNMEVPVVARATFTCINETDGFLSLMDDSGDIREDLKVPRDSNNNMEEAGDKIIKGMADGNTVEVIVLKSCGVEKVIEAKIIE